MVQTQLSTLPNIMDIALSSRSCKRPKNLNDHIVFSSTSDEYSLRDTLAMS